MIDGIFYRIFFSHSQVLSYLIDRSSKMWSRKGRAFIKHHHHSHTIRELPNTPRTHRRVNVRMNKIFRMETDKKPYLFSFRMIRCRFKPMSIKYELKKVEYQLTPLKSIFMLIFTSYSEHAAPPFTFLA